MRSALRSSGDECVDEACDQLAALEGAIRGATPGVVWNEHELPNKGGKEITARWNADGVEVMVSLPAGSKVGLFDAVDRIADAFAGRFAPVSAWKIGDRVRIEAKGKKLHGLEGVVVADEEYDDDDELDEHEVPVRIPYYEGISSVAPVPAAWLRKLAPAVESGAAERESGVATDEDRGPFTEDAALWRALGLQDVRDALEGLKRVGATDQDLFRALVQWPTHREQPGDNDPAGIAWGIVGGSQPAFFAGHFAKHGWPNPKQATLTDTALVKHVRKLLAIPALKAAAPRASKKGGRS